MLLSTAYADLTTGILQLDGKNMVKYPDSRQSGHRWIPLTKTWDAELWCLLWSALNKRLSKQTRRRWFETALCSLWRHSNCLLHIVLIPARRVMRYLLTGQFNSTSSYIKSNIKVIPSDGHRVISRLTRLGDETREIPTKRHFCLSAAISTPVGHRAFRLIGDQQRFLRVKPQSCIRKHWNLNKVPDVLLTYRVFWITLIDWQNYLVSCIADLTKHWAMFWNKKWKTGAPFTYMN